MAKQPQAPHLKVESPPEDIIGMVQGTIPDSKNEWFVALALDKLGIDYSYQVPLYGGRNVRGGQVIDFVVYHPRSIPVFIQGAYWHKAATESEDILKQQAAEAYYKTRPVLLSEEETSTKDKAYRAVLEKIGV
ncbi:MAG: hypothetical protein WAW52_01780 [Methanothrix sp.]